MPTLLIISPSINSLSAASLPDSTRTITSLPSASSILYFCFNELFISFTSSPSIVAPDAEFLDTTVFPSLSSFRITFKTFLEPFLNTITSDLVPGGIRDTIFLRFDGSVIFLLSNLTITSPSSTPAISAGLSSTTCVTRAPSLESISRAFEASSSSGCIYTPNQDLVT